MRSGAIQPEGLHLPFLKRFGDWTLELLTDMQDLKTIWEFIFGGISLCNQVLYEFDQSSVDFDGKAGLEAEVIVMRAWFYLNAMDLFGNVPFTVDFSDTSLPEQV